MEALWSVLTFQCAIYPFVRHWPVPADWEFFWDKNLCTPGPSQAIGTSRCQSRGGEHQPVAFGENQSCRLRSLPSWKLILTLSRYGCQLWTISGRSYYSDMHFPFLKGYQFKRGLIAAYHCNFWPKAGIIMNDTSHWSPFHVYDDRGHVNYKNGIHGFCT